MTSRLPTYILIVLASLFIASQALALDFQGVSNGAGLPPSPLGNYLSCTGVSQISVDNESLPPPNIQTILSDLYAQGRHCTAKGYYLTSLNYVNDPLTTNTTINIQTSQTDTSTVVIDGLELIRYTGLTDAPVVRIVHRNAGTLIINGMSLSNVIHGVKIESTNSNGKVLIFNSVVSGDDKSLTGRCIEVTAANTIMDHVEAYSCMRGVYVGTNSVMIKNESSIHQNKVGIEQADGFSKFFFKRSFSYNNDSGDLAAEPRMDAMKLNQAFAKDLQFMKVQTGEDGSSQAVPAASNESGVFDISGGLYAVLPEGVTGNVSFDIYYADSQSCGMTMAEFGQPCKLYQTKTTLSSLSLPSEGVFVIVMTGSNYGSTLISKPLYFGQVEVDGSINFVQTPLDIPTPGNNDAGNSSLTGDGTNNTGDTGTGDGPANGPNIDTGTGEDDNNDDSSDGMTAGDSHGMGGLGVSSHAAGSCTHSIAAVDPRNHNALVLTVIFILCAASIASVRCRAARRQRS
jgi:hypothetical protein